MIVFKCKSEFNETINNKSRAGRVSARSAAKIVCGCTSALPVYSWSTTRMPAMESSACRRYQIQMLEVSVSTHWIVPTSVVTIAAGEPF